MKTNKIISILLILLFSISNVAAEWFPDSPMVIYWNITWSDVNWKKLKINDWNNTTLKEVNISSNKYGTKKTFDNNKITINPYQWNLNFQIDWYNFKSITKGEINTCENEPTFQKWNICQYNLSFDKINIPAPIVHYSWGGWWGYTYIHTKINKNTNSNSNKNDKNNGQINTVTNKINNNKTINTNPIITPNTKKINIKKDSKWKIIIKWSEYLKTIKLFNKNQRKQNTIFWYKILNIKWHNSYNKTVSKTTKNIYNEIKLDWIRKKAIQYMDNITKDYWILLNDNLDDTLKEKFREKLRYDKKYFTLKIKKLKRKDEIIRHVLEKRKKNIQKQIKKVIETDQITYSIAINAIKMSKDDKFSEVAAWLYFWEKVEHISRKWNIVKVKVLTSRDWYTWKIWYISRKYLRKLK
jgi:hypothetical protein